MDDDDDDEGDQRVYAGCVNIYTQKKCEYKKKGQQNLLYVVVAAVFFIFILRIHS